MIERAQYTLDGEQLKPAKAGISTLDFCCDPPRLWSFTPDQPQGLRFIGWALSRDDSRVRVAISTAAGYRKLVWPVRSRPDVAGYFLDKGIKVQEFCGFDFIIAVNDPGIQGEELLMEVQNGSYSSGPLRIDTARALADLQQASQDNQVSSRGRLDGISDRLVFGWAQVVGSSIPAKVVLTHNGTDVSSAFADEFRQDLLDMRVSMDGHCAFPFTLDFDPPPGDTFGVRVLEDSCELKNSPITIDPMAI